MKNLNDIANDIANDMNGKGFNIDSVESYPKGIKILFKTVKEDKIMINQYFDTDWSSGIKLVFTLNNNTLKFNKIGPFKWRDEKYNTPQNNKTLNNLISEIERFKI